MDADTPRIERVGGETRLVVRGSVQSVAVTAGSPPRGYWAAMLPSGPPSSALILGIGGGTIAALLWQMAPDVPVVGVDCSGEIMQLAQEQLGLRHPRLRLVQADAGDFVRVCTERFDFIVVDLFLGEAAASVMASRSFQRQVRQLVVPGGRVVWNLHRDRRSRTMREQVCRGLLLERRVLVGLNLVLHLRRRHYVAVRKPLANT